MNKLQELFEIVVSLRKIEHEHIEEDDWYSCPCHPDYIGDKDRNKCLCGLEEYNKKIDAALKLILDIGMKC